jgi:hypothetical protein
VPLRFGPTWLPAGLAERGRFVELAGAAGVGLTRSWAPAAGAPAGDGNATRLDVSWRDATGPLDGRGGTRVDVNGRPGFLFTSPAKSTVQWRYDARTVLSVGHHDLGLTGHDLLRVARGLRPERAVMTVPVRVGAPPDGLGPRLVEVVGTSPSAWIVRISGDEQPGVVGDEATMDEARMDEATMDEARMKAGKEGTGGRAASVTLTPATTVPPHARPVPVGGRTGLLSERTRAGGPRPLYDLHVELGPRSWLVVSTAGLARDAVLAIAAAVELTGEPDVRWLARRWS